MIDDLRFRLNDEACEGWSDGELMGSINHAISSLARKLKLWKGSYPITLHSGVSRYELPSDFISPVSFFMGTTPCDIHGREYAMRNILTSGVSFDDRELIVYDIIQTDTPSILHYNVFKRVGTLSETLPIKDEYIDMVMSYALSLSHQKVQSEESIAQSRYYLSLYKDQVKDIQGDVFKHQSSYRIRSTFQKV